jgi:quercetin dioxygenase-like cupin family protein
MISKTLLLCLPAVFTSVTFAQPAPNPPMSSTQPLVSAVFEWDKLPVTRHERGVRRAVFDGPTATVDNSHCHITTLNPGQRSGEPRLHLMEEIIIVKEGTVEVFMDGTTQQAPSGSVIFFAANATTALRNVGDGPATYYVISYVTPLTPKG